MRTRVKFCGLTRAGDVRLACETGVDALGFVFAAGSPRRITAEDARALREAIAPMVTAVALFMDCAEKDIAAAIKALRPGLLQFHGDEEDRFCAGFGVPFLKTLPMGEGAQAPEVVAGRYPSAAGFLLDGHGPGQSGGRGLAFAWRPLPRLERPVVIAGGLHAGNVGEAIAVMRPYAVDVSSGIEVAPGHKDGARMQQYVDEVRRADRTGSE
ncbi:MAG: phosphoribosylanthranilate isomerase [Arenimonas sp.]